MSIITYPDIPLLQKDLIGNANNYYPNKQFAFAIGLNNDVDNTQETVWGFGGPYVFPTSAIQMQVVSSNANDTAAGTGARTVHIQYLDNTYTPQIEAVTLNGVTPVNTVATNILRINVFHVLTAGSGSTAAGNISLQAVGGATTYGYIFLGDNYARQAVYTIPAGKNGYLCGWQAYAGAALLGHLVRVTFNATVDVTDGVLLSGIFLPVSEILCQDNGSIVHYPIPIRFPATSDLKIDVISDNAAANSVVSATGFGWVE